MKKATIKIWVMLAAVLLVRAMPLAAQNPTASGTINAVLINKNGIALVFDSDPAGVTLGAAGSAAATLDFGNISAFGPVAAGVTRPSVTAANFTVHTLFDVQVIEGGLTSTSYTLSASLAAPPPAGVSYKVDAVALTTAAQTVQTNGSYGTDIAHNLDLVVSTAAPGSGGPAVGTPITTTINFTVISN